MLEENSSNIVRSSGADTNFHSAIVLSFIVVSLILGLAASSKALGGSLTLGYGSYLKSGMIQAITPVERAGSIEDGEKMILKKAQVESLFPESTWQRDAYEKFKAKLMNKEEGNKVFPCIYAGRGYRADELHFLFLYSDDLSEPRNVKRVATALRGYLANARATGHHTSLVIMTPNDSLARTGRHKSLEQYRHEYWQFAKQLRRLDPKPWPESIPKDTESHMWCWCFEGIECFMGNMNPAYEKRQTRRAENLCVVYQPKWIFAELFKTDERRDAATAKVRGLIDEYDGVSVSPDISNYGSPGSREARQHFLWDVNVSSECHFREL